MFSLFKNDPLDAAKLETLERAFAIVEFDPTGQILLANPRFLDLMGYSGEELNNVNHRMLIGPDEAQSDGYREFWRRLGRGELIEGAFRRVRKGGERIVVRGVYNPVLDARGGVQRVLKVAQDVTAEARAALETAAKLDAVARMQGVIELSPEGRVLGVNDAMLATLGYARDEVVGRAHDLFVEPGEAAAQENRLLWERLRGGEPVGGVFRRVGRSGRRILLKGSYNPIRDTEGRVVKIVVFSNDLSDILSLGDGLDAIARRDLSCRIHAPFSPEFDKLKADFNAAVEAIGGAIGSVFGSVRFVDRAADQLAEASGMLAKRTEEQAANLEEAAASLDEVSATVGFTSANAGKANDAVERAKRDARTSGDVVGRTVEAMGRIEKSSKQIGSIIGVIDEIAFQTNLLALNAGVEAARAGEAGRGFAVVAAEVRALAQRSAEAARQIKDLVGASSRDVNDGVALVRETGVSLTGIIGQVGEITSLVQQITTGAKEEAAIIAEVNSAVNLVDVATQQNSAMAEEATAAVEALRQQVKELLAAINCFKLEDATALRAA